LAKEHFFQSSPQIFPILLEISYLYAMKHGKAYLKSQIPNPKFQKNTLSGIISPVLYLLYLKIKSITIATAAFQAARGIKTVFPAILYPTQLFINQKQKAPFRGLGV
jgi:hypothetical protein